jgi:DNA integrity scanning protein DisA with diadenylate cyclase activity
MEGRWRLTDITEKYYEFHRAVGDGVLARRLFRAALNLAERRRGGLFVVLDDPRAAAELIAPEDLLEAEPAGSSKAQVHYLLRNKTVLDIEPSVLESIARVDGAILLDRAAHLLAFGAIVRHVEQGLPAQDGGRTTAAVHASRFGPVLKISEDGGVSYFRDGSRVWEI